MHRIPLLISAAVLLSGCVGVNPRERGLKDDAATDYIAGLIQPGRTSRSDTLAALGRPTRQLDDGRVMCFRIGCTEGGKVINAGHGEVLRDWIGVSQSVVVIFDQRGIVRNYSVVSVRGKIDAEPLKESKT